MGTEDWARRDWVLLPGTLCTGEVFDGFLDALAVPPQHRHVIDLSRPRIEQYTELLERCCNAVVCGFSLGAIVASHWADRVQAARLLLFGVNPLADDPAKAPGRRTLAEDVATKGGAAALDSRLPTFGGPHADAARVQVLAMADACAHQITAQTELALSRPGALSALGRACCPVLALTGSDDAMAPGHLGQQAAAAAPGGCFQSLEGLGHYALLEDPVTCAEAVLLKARK